MWKCGFICQCVGDKFAPKKYASGRGSNVGQRSAGPLLGDCKAGGGDWRVGGIGRWCFKIITACITPFSVHQQQLPLSLPLFDHAGFMIESAS